MATRNGAGQLRQSWPVPLIAITSLLDAFNLPNEEHIRQHTNDVDRGHVRLVQFELVWAYYPLRRARHRQTLRIDHTVDVLSARLRRRPCQRPLLRRCQDPGQVSAVGAPATGEASRPVVGRALGLSKFGLETTSTFVQQRGILDSGTATSSMANHRLQT